MERALRLKQQLTDKIFMITKLTMPHATSFVTPLASKQQIIQVARQAILSRLHRDDMFNLDPGDYAAALTRNGAAFITLTLDNELRGCVGSLVAHRALIIDVASNAQAAAFDDHRFTPLTLEEFQEVELHASILSTPETLNVSTRQELIDMIRPGQDGLILEEQGKRATYLPSVWSQLPDPEQFVSELRKKAGLAANEWDQCIVQRYTTEEFV